MRNLPAAFAGAAFDPPVAVARAVPNLKDGPVYIEPDLGRRPLNTITRADVEAIVEAAPSPWRAQDAVKMLRMILGRATKARKIAANAASGIELPKIEHREPRTLSAEELERLVEAMPDRWRAFVLVAAYSSLRFSELVGLRVDRLDLPRSACASRRRSPRRAT